MRRPTVALAHGFIKPSEKLGGFGVKGGVSTAPHAKAIRGCPHARVFFLLVLTTLRTKIHLTLLVRRQRGVYCQNNDNGVILRPSKMVI